MSEKSVSDNKGAVLKTNAGSRLPCRGCTVNCKNYHHCDGAPWRVSSPNRKDNQK